MIYLRRQSFVEVVDERPDDEMPQVTVFAPVSGSTLDTRRSGRMTATARIADADTGVGPAPLFCLPRPQWPDLPCQEQSCTHATLVAGDRHDGTWQAVLQAPSKRGFLSWPACLFVSATDAARPWSLEGRYTCRPIAQQFGWTVTDGQSEPFTILGR